MEHDKGFEEILGRRACPPASRKDLSERIIHAALFSSTAVREGWIEKLRPIFDLNKNRAVWAGGLACVVALLMVFDVGVNTAVQTSQTHVLDTEFTAALNIFDEQQSL